jgi:hypothetical protein
LNAGKFSTELKQTLLGTNAYKSSKRMWTRMGRQSSCIDPGLSGKRVLILERVQPLIAIFEISLGKSNIARKRDVGSQFEKVL